MNKVIYRDLSREDYEQIKYLIDEAFEFSTFIKDRKFLDYTLTLYLQSCILDSSFGKVAIKDGNVIGVILGNASNDKNRLKKPHNILASLCSLFKLTFLSWKNREAIKSFIKINNTYKEIIQGKNEDFDGVLQLFIVSEKSRNLGLGKTLLSQLLEYMKEMSVKSFYLYTDDRCNYKFYERQNFKRINEKEISIHSFKQKLNVFLYSYRVS